MRLLIDTKTGLAVIDKGYASDWLDAIIIGSSPLPKYIGLLDDGHVSLAPETLAEILDPRSERELDEFRALVTALQRNNGTNAAADGQRIRVQVAEWLS
ncbi:hypothetical protein E0K89_001005 [Aquicoccus sp. SCR17]|nr:hypothetical protein [Carideicomes alvinocaridis]